MKISVIGCSTTWSDRPTSSYCINDNILVDAGEGTLKNYKNTKVEVENIKYIFLTHLHSDHTFAVINHIYNRIWSYQTRKNELFIYGPKGTKQYLKNLIKLMLPEYKNMDMSGFLHITEIENFEQKVQIENMNVSFYKLKHGILQNIAYIFDDGKTKVGFSGDCTYTKNLDKFIANSEILFLECCDLKTSKNHLGYDLFSLYQKKYTEKTFFAIHCSDDVYNNAKKLKLKVAKHSQIYQTEQICEKEF